LPDLHEPAPVVVLGVHAGQVGAGCGELLLPEEDEAIQVALGRGADQRPMGRIAPQRCLLNWGRRAAPAGGEHDSEVE
jgi:hypothetical protein